MMINRKDTPAPFMQRADPPSPRAFKPTTQQSAPQTPQHKMRSKRTSKLQRPNPRETYIDGNARGAADELPRDERISHDLSLTDNTRHSVVDNMLMSLNPDDQNLFSHSQGGRPTDSAGSDLTSPPRSAHQPRHLHSSSTNSDYTFLSEDSPDRHSYQFGRGRRSNSSSNFQSALRRIDSVHAEGETADARKAKAVQAQQAGRIEATTKGHARKGSKGSGASSSIDYGQMMGQHRMPNSLGRRSASFDHGYGRRVLHSASNSGNHAPMPMPSSLSQPILYNDMEAAPTPTVPGGPRRDHSPAFPPRPMHAPPIAPLPQRRDSLKSSKSHHTKKSKGETLHKDTPVPVSGGFQRSRRGSKQINPLPGFMKARNPSPVRQFSEPAPAVRQESSVHPKDVPKERPGFFRRVFGSSRAPPPLANDPYASQPPQTRPSRDGTKASNRNDNASTNKLRRAPTGEDIAHHPPESTAPPLVKKPSSFFRRRKKSISEAMPPPMLPLHLQAHAANMNAEPQRSPVSSLRKVMNPYLDTPIPSQPILEAGPMPSSREFDAVSTLHNHVYPRPSFEPPLTENAPTPDAEALITSRQARDRLPPSRENPNPRTYLNPDDGPFKPSDNSFLHDDSSIENRTPEADDSVQPFRLDSAPTHLGATSVRADMTPRRTTSKDAVEKLKQTYFNSARTANAPSPRNIGVPSSARSNDSSSKKIEAKDWLGSSQVTPTRAHHSPPGSSDNLDRVWLQPVDSSEVSRKMSLPIEGAEISPVSDYHSASSTLHPLKANNLVEFPEQTTEDLERKLTVEIDPSQPSATDRTRAKLVFEGDESIAPKAMAAAWLGEPGSDRARVRKAYMELFEWQNLNILAALRGLCGRLYLKGEAQQVDRILDAFSTRWCACNPLHGFKATGMNNHTISMPVLLNLDRRRAYNLLLGPAPEYRPASS